MMYYEDNLKVEKKASVLTPKEQKKARRDNFISWLKITVTPLAAARLALLVLLGNFIYGELDSSSYQHFLLYDILPLSAVHEFFEGFHTLH